MLRVTVEILPFGGKGNARTLGVLEIANCGPMLGAPNDDKKWTSYEVRGYDNFDAYNAKILFVETHADCGWASLVRTALHEFYAKWPSFGSFRGARDETQS